MGQMGQMMKQAQMMQMNIQKAQKELETIEVTGEAGNGMVKVTMTCKNVCRRVMIDDSLVGAGNRWYETPVLIQWNKSEQLPN